MDIKHIFVYGTLMRGMDNHHLVETYAENITPGSLTGELYHLAYGYPALSAGYSPVWGEIIALANMSEALSVIDDLEGYLGPGQHDNLYSRVVRRARRADGETVNVYVYLWARPEQLSEIGQQVAGGCWRSFIR
jgi:gamma-glutamylcyclotransferase (GGCT)/AIG2-like uncharacterized protein YtfP